MTVREFKKYIETNRVKRVIFCSENQEHYKVSNPCKFRMTFPVILIAENPNIICLKNKKNSLTFDRVTAVDVDSKFSVLGDVVTVICGKGEYTYILIVDYLKP